MVKKRVQTEMEEFPKTTFDPKTPSSLRLFIFSKKSIFHLSTWESEGKLGKMRGETVTNPWASEASGLLGPISLKAACKSPNKELASIAAPQARETEEYAGPKA